MRESCSCLRHGHATEGERDRRCWTAFGATTCRRERREEPGNRPCQVQQLLWGRHAAHSCGGQDSRTGDRPPHIWLPHELPVCLTAGAEKGRQLVTLCGGHGGQSGAGRGRGIGGFLSEARLWPGLRCATPGVRSVLTGPSAGQGLPDNLLSCLCPCPRSSASRGPAIHIPSQCACLLSPCHAREASSHTCHCRVSRQACPLPCHGASLLSLPHVRAWPGQGLGTPYLLA